jgi:hypothetical protein
LPVKPWHVDRFGGIQLKAKTWPKSDDPLLKRFATEPRLAEGKLPWLSLVLPGIVFVPISLVFSVLFVSSLISGQMNASVAMRGVMVIGALLFVGAAYPVSVIWRFRGRRYAVTKNAFLLLDEERVIVWPLEQISGVVMRRGLFSWQVKLSTRRAPRISVSADQASTLAKIFLSFGLPVDAPKQFEGAKGLELLTPDESILWSGRPGPFGLDPEERLLAIFGAIALGVCYALMYWVLHRIWGWNWPLASVPYRILSQLLWTFTVLILFAGPIYAILAGFGRWRDIVSALFGELAITNRRIVWLDPFDGHIRREIRLADISEAILIEKKYNRGWVNLAPAAEQDPSKDTDLFGLPRPEDAVAAINNAVGATS